MTDLFKINFKHEDVVKIQNKIKEFNWSKISSLKTWEMGTNPKKLKNYVNIGQTNMTGLKIRII